MAPSAPAKRERIQWTTEEIQQIVDRFAELRAENPIGPFLPQLEEAQQALPSGRRRKCPTLDIYGGEFKRVLAIKVAEMKAKLKQPLRAPTDDEPTILTIEVPKIVEVVKQGDPALTLLSMSVGTILGHGIDRLLSDLHNSKVPLNGTNGHSPEKPAREYLAKVDEKPVVPRPIRVLAVGVFPDSKRYIEDKIKGLTNIDLSICDSSQNKIPSGTFEYVIMLRRIVSHTQAQQVRDIHGRERLLFVEGGQAELLKKLADINSQRDVSS